jgi:hypothetical protein
MPNRTRTQAKKSQNVKKAPSTPVSAKTPKPEDPVAAFLARMGSPKAADRELDPARRREAARRAARMSAIAEAKAAGEPKKR